MTDNFLRKSKLALALLGFPKLLRHPKMLNNALNDYEEIKKDNGEIEQLYNAYPYVLSSDDKSNLRHTYTNAKFIRQYPEYFLDNLGKYKEFVDTLDFKPKEDTKLDLINNQYGIELGKQYLTAPNVTIFDETLQHFGLPILPRNNVLYGYISND